MSDIFDIYDAWVMALLLAAVMLGAWIFGVWTGRRRRERGVNPPVPKFDDAILTLLSLLLSFTFGMSIIKHDNRRTMVVADSNAIGDFYTCASLLKEPARTKLQTLIRDYAKIRLDTAREQLRGEAFEAALQQFQQMQSQMTELVSAALNQGTPIAVSLTNTLNGLTSNHATRLAAVRDRLPGSILLLLFAAAIVSITLAGREQAAAGNVEVVGTICFVVLVTFAVYVTLDLNQPGRGLITVSQEPIERLLSTMPK
jgi:hypothetical protein